MTHSISHIIFQIALGLFTAVGILVLIDYYIFSWTGVFLHLIRFCQYKEVSECFFCKIKKLSSPVDVDAIRRKIALDESYTIHPRIKHGVRSKRRFGKVVYYVQIDYDGKFSFGTSIEKDIEDWLGEQGGENCWKPNYFIRRHVHQIINDLPVTKAQKKELKKSVWVLPVPDFTINLF